MDLFIGDINDISAGNMRSHAQQQVDQAVADHNQIIAQKITDLHKDLQSKKTAITENETLRQVQDGITGLMGSASMKTAIQNYNQYKAKGASKASALNDLKQQGGGLDGDIRVGQGDSGEVSRATPELTTSDPAPSATPEGTSATGTSDVAPTAEAHESVTVGGDEVNGEEGSMLKKGMKGLGLSEETAGKATRALGAAGAVAQGGYDIYEDIKAGGIAGANGWEKAGNVTQIGASALDLVGVAFPPAEILGGALGLIGGGLDAIGAGIEGGKEERQAKQTEADEEAKAEKEKQVQVPVAQAPAVAQRQVQ